MLEKSLLLRNLDNIHTTKLGLERLSKNINVDIDKVIFYCKEAIKNSESIIYKNGKNYYCEFDNVRITINSYSYTIIIAHTIK